MFGHSQKVVGRNKSPARELGELMTEVILLGIILGEALANQNENKELAVVFSSLYDSLKQNAQQIDDELIAAQGQPQDVGGYYMPNDE